MWCGTLPLGIIHWKKTRTQHVYGKIWKLWNFRKVKISRKKNLCWSAESKWTWWSALKGLVCVLWQGPCEVICVQSDSLVWRIWKEYLRIFELHFFKDGIKCYYLRMELIIDARKLYPLKDTMFYKKCGLSLQQEKKVGSLIVSGLRGHFFNYVNPITARDFQVKAS